MLAFEATSGFAAAMHSAAPLPDEAIIDALRGAWGLTVKRATYAQVGYGSWHWHAMAAPHGSLFVTLDQVTSEPAASGRFLSLAELTWAYRVPFALARAGFTLARPPLPTAGGNILASLDHTWVLSVWPVIEGRSSQRGRYLEEQDARDALAVVRALHDVPITVLPKDNVRRESFRIPGIQRLLRLVDEPWSEPHVGPHAAAGEEVLHRHAAVIRRVASLHDDLVRRAPPRNRWVITHGEPHAANVVFTDAGPVLIDWDTAKLAPKERDVWMIAADGFDIGDADEAMLRLYRTQWDLREVADYAWRFADPNDDGPVGDAAWADFMSYIERAPSIA